MSTQTPCQHNSVERIETSDGFVWLCSNPSCRTQFRHHLEVAAVVADAVEVGLEHIAGVMSSVLWDQTERMTEWLLGHGATQQEADEAAEKKEAFYLDASAHAVKHHEEPSA